MSFTKQIVIDAKSLKIRFELSNISQYFNGAIKSETVQFGKGRWSLYIKVLKQEDSVNILLQDECYTKKVSCTLSLLGIDDELLCAKVFKGSSKTYEPFYWISAISRSELMKKISPRYNFTVAFELEMIEDVKKSNITSVELKFPNEMRNLCTHSFHDINIEVEGKTIPAHRFLLSTYSQVFYQAIQNLDSPSAPLKVDSFNFECIQEIINFIYGKDIKFTDSNTVTILLAAKKFKIASLENRCERFIFEKLAADNAFETLVFANLNSINFLSKETMKFIMKNMKEIAKMEDHWHKFVTNRPSLFKLVFEYAVRRNILLITESEPVQEPSVTSTSAMNNDYEKLFETKAFADVIFAVEGKLIEAHKCILSCRSAVFQTMFTHENTLEAKENIIRITDCDYKTMVVFLSYIYSGKIINLEENAMHLYAVADKYNVEDLKKICSNYINKNITVDNFTEVLKLANLYSDMRILETASKFIHKNYTDVFDTIKWNNFANKNSGILSRMLIRQLEANN